jgi:hypothetical protein
MFERFTDRSRRVLVLAQEEAHQLNHGFIGTEHILLGLISEGHGVGARALESLDVTLERARGKVADTLGTAGSAPPGSPPFTPRAKKVFELSLREALQLGHSFIGTEHILLGLLREGDGVAAQVLVSLGTDLGVVRQRVIELISEQGYRVEEGSMLSDDRVAGHFVGAHPSSLRAGTLAECSFCGRRPPESGRLVSGTDALICEHCVAEWFRVLASEDEPRFRRPMGTGSGSVRPIGPPSPDDATRAKIRRLRRDPRNPE